MSLIKYKLQKYVELFYCEQWRIQDFPEEGAPTPQGGANVRFCQIFPKTA